jgi:ADP-ribose pyrophosphatase YjhB (NUDIX family)
MAESREIISLASGDRAFNLRVAAVILHNGNVLIHRAAHEDFWTLPGGRIEMGEPAAAALAREMQEELQVEVEVGRLLWLVENFFEYAGKRWHEIAFYFEVALPVGCPLYDAAEPFTGTEDFYLDDGTPLQLIFQWHPVADLENVLLLPSFLRTALGSPPEHTHCIVHEDV